MFNKILPMTGVEPRTSGIEIDRSTNWATTTSLTVFIVLLVVVKVVAKHFRTHSVCVDVVCAEHVRVVVSVGGNT